LANWKYVPTESLLSSSTLAIKTDGTLWSWGYNAQGQLGLGNTISYSSPKQVGALTNWLTVAAAYHTLAIKTDGTLWAWGNNNQGQLGLGNTVNYSSPVQVGLLTNWLKVAAAYAYPSQSGFSVAIQKNGTLWAWGQNTAGQLGLGNTTNYSSPKQIGLLTNWQDVSIFGLIDFSTLALKSDGTLWSWGSNSYGQLGLGNLTSYSSPKQVGSLTNWLKISGSYHVLAIKTNGTLWSWGFNNFGQLGNGTNSQTQSPAQVGALTTWLNVSAGIYHSLVVKTDGTLWAWGNNTQGQLGLGNRTNYSSPVQVGSLATWGLPAARLYSSLALSS
jgi:hypothetical protein